MSATKGLSYIKQDTPIHHLCGASKLLMVVLASLAAMITFDTRFLVLIIITSFTMFTIAKVPLKDIKLILQRLAVRTGGAQLCVVTMY